MNDQPDLTQVIQQAVEQTLAVFTERQEARQRGPQADELAQERKKREQLEKRVNELVEEGRRAREAAELADRCATIKGELQQLGVSKVELAFRAVRDDVRRAEDGKLYAHTEEGAVPLRDFLAQWVSVNPEFKPARIAGGAGSPPPSTRGAAGPAFELERIRPGMSAEDRERARQEIARVAGAALGSTVI
jgi:hypothetical protein